MSPVRARRTSTAHARAIAYSTLVGVLLAGPSWAAGRATPMTFGPDRLPAVSDAEDPLVDAAPLVPGLVVRLTYATEQNLSGKRLYPADAKCLLRRSIADRLAVAARVLERDGLRLVAWDCYRPHAVQVALFQAHPHPGQVGDPAKGSYHQRGVAIDLGLVARDGSAVPLPTAHDEFNARTPAAAALAEGPALENRRRLHGALYDAGFRPNPKEWWHFARLWGGRWPAVERALGD